MKMLKKTPACLAILVQVDHIVFFPRNLLFFFFLIYKFYILKFRIVIYQSLLSPESVLCCVAVLSELLFPLSVSDFVKCFSFSQPSHSSKNTFHKLLISQKFLVYFKEVTQP